ncbi:MAG TPA: 4Fe-4S ferredoxin, partial [Nitrospirota bacterium]|nr:4Fe-4S ferredoxin [Nitrospirota bacterium]
MQDLSEHPAVKRFYQRNESKAGLKSDPRNQMFKSADVRRLCLDFGANDVGFVNMNRPELDDQREDILKMFPWTKTLVSLVGRLNRENMRSPARSIASLELHK